MNPKHREQAYHLAGIGHWEFELENNVLYWSDEIKNLHDVPLDYQPTVEDAIAFYEKGENRRSVQKAVEGAIDNGEGYVIEAKIITAKGNERWVKSIGEPVFENGQCIRLYGSTQDITAHKKREQKIKKQQKKLNLLSRVASETQNMVIITDPHERIEWVNEAFTRVTGYTQQDVLGKNPGRLLQGPETDQKTVRRIAAKIDAGKPFSEEILNYTRAGNPYWLKMDVTPITDDKGNITQFFSIQEDITEQKQTEQKLEDSLKEKETLLMEIHHRVKNNLAVVSGLMQLQAYKSDDELLRQKLDDSVSRIKTMASIHELLYNSDSFSKLDAAEIIQKLINEILTGFGSKTTLNTKFDLQSIELNINQAIPLSLIINEVVTNILKHAFIDVDTGTLAVFISEKNKLVRLRITDNGKGLPEGFPDVVKTNSLGLELIETLSQQLKADYIYETVSGETHFTLTFEKTDVKGIGSAM